MSYENMEKEELIEKLTERDLLIATMETEKNQNASNQLDLEAEKTSLTKELEEYKQKLEAQTEELKKTKELNFTLGRQVANTSEQLSIEQALHNVYGENREKE